MKLKDSGLVAYFGFTFDMSVEAQLAQAEHSET